MVNKTIAYQRLSQQQIIDSRFQTPTEVVAWLGAVQAQEYLEAKWALGLRLPGATEATVEQACADGAILRTHVMRPTWHFLAPADIRWMLALTGPRVHAVNAHMYRRTELDEAVFRRTQSIITQALEGGRCLTRAEIAAALEAAGIPAKGLRLTYIVMQAELEGLICSGPRRGKQFTYALLEERVPPAPVLDRDEALAELVRRYFTSHGPATLRDFAWWSGLTQADAKRGLELVGGEIVQAENDGQTYWQAASLAPADGATLPAALLLPVYDEFGIGYMDRTTFLAAEHAERVKNEVYAGVLLREGELVGTWRRTFRRGAVVMDIETFHPLDPAEEAAFAAEARRYGDFLGLAVERGEGWRGG